MTVNYDDYPYLGIFGGYVDTYKGDTFTVAGELGTGCVFAGDQENRSEVTVIFLPNKNLTTAFRKLDFPNLQILWLSNNQLSDIALDNGLTELTEINLRNNLFQELALVSLPKLNTILIENNRFTAAAISNILQDIVNNGTTNGIFQASVFNRRNLISNNENLANFGAENIANRIYDSSLDLWKVIENTANTTHRISRSFSVISGQSYTISIYIKAAERNVFYFQDGGAGQPNQRILFDLNTLNIVYVGLTSFTNGIIEHVGNQIYRVSARYAPASTSTVIMLFGIAVTTSNPIYLGNGTSGIFMGKPQFELGTTATEYDPNPLSKDGAAALATLQTRLWTVQIS